MNKLEYVIPVYNEEKCLPELMSRLENVRNKLTELDVHILFINDGSADRSREQLIEFTRRYDYVRVIDLSRNFGHQYALTAGLDFCDADYICIIDGDMQDPPELVSEMLAKLQKESLNIVYGKRRQRQGETLFKKVTANAYYRLLNRMCQLEIPRDTGDFRLIDRKVVDALREMKETHRFIRGMVPWLGFKSAPFLYDRDARFAGDTKYTLRKMLRLAFDGMFSFSRKPLRVASYVGVVVALGGFVGLAYMIFLKLFTDDVVPGITVILTAISILGGVQLLMLGVVGEYLGRVFEQTKQRPLYIIDNIYAGESDER
ncbi:MAG: glycosyltransferase family 2 protein [Gammaproteobacteria bacterium]|nr:glycosyltransferase family 2 protein [Gammaproteobacteria bacterium]MDH5653135.1 glycosyltransferase family 2 protein [Gammaproteobacteria bacterium]